MSSLDTNLIQDRPDSAIANLGLPSRVWTPQSWMCSRLSRRRNGLSSYASSREIDDGEEEDDDYDDGDDDCEYEDVDDGGGDGDEEDVTSSETIKPRLLC